MSILYKKKNLKFESGRVDLSRDLRGIERSTARAALRHTRFSLLRCLENEGETEENSDEKPESIASSRIPALGTLQGKSNLKAPLSRSDMLKKWKEDRDRRRQEELKTKKPTFKMGLPKPKVVQKLLPFERSTDNTSSKSCSRLKTSADSRTKPSNRACMKTIAETTAQQSSSIKLPASSKNVKSFTSKESSIQIPNQKHPVLGNYHQKAKTESRLQVPTKSQIVPKKMPATTKEVSSKLHTSEVPKPTQSKIIKPQQANSYGIPRIGNKKVPESKQSQFASSIQQPNKSKTNLPKPSFTSKSQMNIEKNSLKMGDVPEKAATATQVKPTGISRNTRLIPKVQTKNVKKIDIPKKKKEEISSNITFECELSCIEPPKTNDTRFCLLEEGGITALFSKLRGGTEKTCELSLFEPPKTNNTSFSFLEEGGITAIYSKLRAGTARTSTPIRADIQVNKEEVGEISCNLAKDSPETEVFESPEKKTSFNETYHQAETNFPEVQFEGKPSVAVTTDEEPKTLSLEQEDSITRDKRFDIDNDENVSEVNSLPCPEKTSEMKETEEKFAYQQKSDSLRKPNLVRNLLEDSLPVLETSPLLKTASEFLLPQKETGIFKKPLPVYLLEDSLLVCKEKCSTLSNGTTSKVSQYQKTDLLNALPIKLESSEMEKDENSANIKDCPKLKLSLETLKVQVAAKSMPEERDPLLPIKIEPNTSEHHKESSLNEGASIIARRQTRSSDPRRIRSFRKSEMPLLESICESTENDSLSAESPLKPRKTKKSVVPKDFTPRRSSRLARKSYLEENLDDVRLSLCEMSPDLENGAHGYEDFTYDFDNLHLEPDLSKKVAPSVEPGPSTRKGKVSLLYTPTKGRVSTLRKSIKGDLMSFSPDV